MAGFEPIDGATPIEDLSDLIPTHIISRQELNEWETTNILEAAKKYLLRKREIKIDLAFIKEVHYEMFSHTWKWAGKFRQSNFNIGVDWHNIQEELKKLVDDLVFWQGQEKGFDFFAQSVRIHHRLVLIHPFINGNGRHARLISDIFLFSHGEKLPIWPSQEMLEETNIRQNYIEALKATDKGDYRPLETVTKGLIK
ncbi:MAG: mobile mystery protein B [Candidatus Margulisiibacteriota bacterium]